MIIHDSSSQFLDLHVLISTSTNHRHRQWLFLEAFKTFSAAATHGLFLSTSKISNFILVLPRQPFLSPTLPPPTASPLGKFPFLDKCNIILDLYIL